MHKTNGITVRELLNLEILKDSQVLSGSGGLDHRILKMNVMEVPDILDWVRAGEFLLTTAYSIRETPERLKGLVEALSAKGVAGLGIKTRRFIQEIPQDALAISEALNFPIVEIPYTASFSDVIQPVLTEVMNQQMAMLQRIDAFNDRLMKLMLRGGGMEEIARAVQEAMGVSIAIMDDIFRSHVVLCGPELRSDIEAVIHALDHQRQKPAAYDEQKGEYIRFTDTLSGRTVNRYMIPIKSEERKYGRIMLWEDQRTLTPMDLSTIEAATSLVALDLMKKLSLFEGENKHRIEFFEDLLSEDENRQRQALEKAAYFDFDGSQVYSVIIISYSQSEAAYRMTPNNTGYLNFLGGRLVSLVERQNWYGGHRILFGSKSDRMILMFGSSPVKGDSEIKTDILRFSQEIQKAAAGEGLGELIAIGIGRPCREFSRLPHSYREAGRAVETGRLNPGQKGPVHYDDLGIYRILSYEELQPELSQFYRETLEPLVNYDREKDSQLVETLKKYFECRSNLKRVSEVMFTHYNTVIYRMQRIRDIIGRDLDDPDVRLNLQIALKVLDLMGRDRGR